MAFEKANQLLELAVMVAATRGGVTLQEVSERFGGSHRTTQRMMAALEAFLPDVVASMSDDGRKRWRIEGGHLRELLWLESEELASLDLAIAELDRSGSSLEAHALGRLKEKILALVPRKRMARLETDHEALLEAHGLIARPGPRPKFDAAVAIEILEAIKACAIVELHYQSRADEAPRARLVAPYGVLSGARRYLVGKPIEDQTSRIRTYRLDGVRSARRTDQSFIRPKGFDLQAFANKAFGVYQNDDEYSDVVWRFAASVADSVRSYEFHPEQTIKDEDDGAITVRFKASGWLEMCWHLYAWGDKVEVIEPKKLAAMVNPYRRPDFPAIP